MLYRLPVIFALACLLVSCATQSPSYQAGTPCEAETYTVVDNFAGARRGRCVVLSDNHVRIRILPEDDGYINDSPWFAFKVVPRAATTATITIDYFGGHHRYVPKISRDGLHWSSISGDDLDESRDGKQASFTVETGETPFWVSAQEILTPRYYEVWNRKMAATGRANVTILGESLGKRPIAMLQNNPSADNVLFLVGRQHPAEVTGAIALFAFYETLLADTKLATEFRQHVNIVAIPLLNPDGVIGGNWRHNLGGTDLNRDWGPFKQPETKLIRALLDELDSNGKKVRVFLDFHSTQKNVFYTQNDEYPTTPALFTRTWLDNARPRIQNYDYGNQENPADKPGVAKNYMYKRYGIPSSTYEVGDETDRAAIREAAKVFAEELMLLMLEQDYRSPPDVI